MIQRKRRFLSHTGRTAFGQIKSHDRALEEAPCKTNLSARVPLSRHATGESYRRESHQTFFSCRSITQGNLQRIHGVNMSLEGQTTHWNVNWTINPHQSGVKLWEKESVVGWSQTHIAVDWAEYLRRGGQLVSSWRESRDMLPRKLDLMSIADSGIFPESAGRYSVCGIW